MAALPGRDVDEVLKRSLRTWVARNGVSMEEEARRIPRPWMPSPRRVCYAARMPSLLERAERRMTAAMLAKRPALLRRLAEAAAGEAWEYVLFGSFARGDVHRNSDADVAIVLLPGHDPRDATRAWVAACRVCVELDLDPDVHVLDDLPPEIADRVRTEGVRATL